VASSAELVRSILGGLEGIDENKRIQAEFDATAGHDLHGAADALQRGAVDAGRLRELGGELISRQKVAYANSGVDPTVGTAANVQAGTAADVELDVQTRKNNAAAEAWGFDQHRAQAFTEAQYKTSANQRKTVGTVLGGGGQLLDGSLKAFG
jgi:hypothetical protein